MHSLPLRRRRKSHFIENLKYRIFWTFAHSPFGLCVVTFCTLVFTATCVEGNVASNGPDYTFGGKVQNIPMTTEHGLEMVQHWMDNMLGSFIATFGDRK
ncbi:hypothetical protein DdX_14575 [Ditylenchus destructor]|uniref:Uncharacterized protein n=1 Tax=Ditylenchus destructor TaxID=166010 RepID=A0AAD4MQX4_9BILA|nr:hypothetical protein DdX_14575 [Ditylenchus destructor]